MCQVEEKRCGSESKTTPKEKLVNDNLEIIKDKTEAFFLEPLKLKDTLYGRDRKGHPAKDTEEEAQLEIE